MSTSAPSAELPEAAVEETVPGAEVPQQLADWLATETGVSEPAARQLADYFLAIYKALGVIPSQKTLVLERFFDESGGMQLVIHSPFGIRINRAWGLALRKRFCRSFNFELQAAATDDAIVLSLGTQHSFPLEDVFRFLHSNTVRDVLVQALLDAPMFGIHWRWNASRALALPRQRGGRKVPAPLQRMESENLLAAVFPDQLACLENIAGDREVPDHPLVRQTIDDCLTEVMDIDGLIAVLKKIEGGEIECVARDLPEPSPLASEILNARPYAFLDNAPLEERRTQAVYTRRAGDQSSNDGLGILDQAAIDKVVAEAWPRATNADELHEALLLAVVMTEGEMTRTSQTEEHENAGPADTPLAASAPQSAVIAPSPPVQGRAGERRPAARLEFVENLVADKRVCRLGNAPPFWIAAERRPLLQTIYPSAHPEPLVVAPEADQKRVWDRGDAIRELVRGRMEVSGPLTATALSDFLKLPLGEINTALLALEGEGFILRGRFRSRTAFDRLSGRDRTESPPEDPGSAAPAETAPRTNIEPEIEWCDRRLLARIHRLTINRLRAEIQPVSIAEFQRFLLSWQRAGTGNQAEGPDGVEAVLRLLDAYQVAAAAWEPEVLALRIKDFSPRWLDQLCFTGRFGWGRLSAPQNGARRPATPIRSSPVSLFSRENLSHWLALSAGVEPGEFTPDTMKVWKALLDGGALFFGELVKKTALLPSKVEQGLAELAAQGWVTSDSFEGLRALLLPRDKRTPFVDSGRKRHHRSVTSVEFAGRWSVLRAPATVVDSASHAGGNGSGTTANVEAAGRERAIEMFARTLLYRYGVIFRRLLEREAFTVSWFELGRVYRRLEARGEIRGGHFVSGVSGEQFALSEAIGSLRAIRKQPARGELVAISGADPLNLAGILSPGPRIAAFASNRILLRDGVPIAALESGATLNLETPGLPLDAATERSLRVGKLPTELRPYYSR